MPWNQVMSKWGKGNLTSGSKGGPPVNSQKQAVAIMLSEKRAAKAGKQEYAPAPMKGMKAKVRATFKPKRARVTGNV
jgi:Family of unknown function (DUF6496)